MGKELVSRDELEKSKKGKIHISSDRLISMSLGDHKAAEEGVNRVVEANPDYSFYISDDVIHGGIWIMWKKEERLHWHGNSMCVEEKCDPGYILTHNPPSNWGR